MVQSLSALVAIQATASKPAESILGPDLENGIFYLQEVFYLHAGRQGTTYAFHNRCITLFTGCCTCIPFSDLFYDIIERFEQNVTELLGHAQDSRRRTPPKGMA